MHGYGNRRRFGGLRFSGAAGNWFVRTRVASHGTLPQ